MATLNIPYSFTNGTAANATEVNSDFSAVKTFAESQVVHADGAVQATTNSYANLSVTGAKIADATIAREKFASGIQPVNLVTSVGALPAGVDGMVAYVNSNDASEGLYTFNGTAWRRGPGWNAPWGIAATSSKTSNQAISSTTYVDVTGLSVSWSAVANRLYVVRAYMKVAIGTAGTFDFQLCDSGATVQYQAVTVNSVLGAAGDYVILEYPIVPPAGTSSSKVRAKVDTGSANVNGSITAPSYITVMDMGPSGAPA